VEEVEETDSTNRRLALEFRERGNAGTPRAAPKALRAFFSRALAPVVAAAVHMGASKNSTIIVPVADHVAHVAHYLDHGQPLRFTLAVQLPREAIATLNGASRLAAASGSEEHIAHDDSSVFARQLEASVVGRRRGGVFQLESSKNSSIPTARSTGSKSI
jgi:hypothetical protein